VRYLFPYLLIDQQHTISVVLVSTSDAVNSRTAPLVEASIHANMKRRIIFSQITETYPRNRTLIKIHDASLPTQACKTEPSSSFDSPTRNGPQRRSDLEPLVERRNIVRHVVLFFPNRQTIACSLYRLKGTRNNGKKA
jgi:hypothetical protein